MLKSLRFLSFLLHYTYCKLYLTDIKCIGCHTEHVGIGDDLEMKEKNSCMLKGFFEGEKDHPDVLRFSSTLVKSPDICNVKISPLRLVNIPAISAIVYEYALSGSSTYSIMQLSFNFSKSELDKIYKEDVDFNIICKNSIVYDHNEYSIHRPIFFQPSYPKILAIIHFNWRIMSYALERFVYLYKPVFPMMTFVTGDNQFFNASTPFGSKSHMTFFLYTISFFISHGISKQNFFM